MKAEDEALELLQNIPVDLYETAVRMFRRYTTDRMTSFLNPREIATVLASDHFRLTLESEKKMSGSYGGMA